MIQLIGKEFLRHHPDNPRKDFGDLSELTTSIEKNGILQNLTVMPSEDGECFYVLIGNRRLEASKNLDQITELPCEVYTRPLSKDEAVSIMLTENIIRENLTAYEEAEGFQYMLDLGSSVEQVAEKYGYSKSTVSKRTNLLSLDKTKFKSAVERGATLFDMEKIEKIGDEAARKKLLDKAGTRDFDMALKRAQEEEERADYLESIHDKVIEFASEIEKTEYESGVNVAVIGEEKFPVKFVISYNTYSGKKEYDPSTIEEGHEYFFKESGYAIEIYMKLGEDEISAKEKEKAEKEMIAANNERMMSYMRELRENIRQLHDEFIIGYTKSKKILKDIVPYAADAILKCNAVREDTVVPIFGLTEENIVRPNSYTKEYVLNPEEPEKNLVRAIYVSLLYENDPPCICSHEDDGVKYYFKENYTNRMLEYLNVLGYEMSEEEEGYYNGTHAIYSQREPEVEEESA